MVSIYSQIEKLGNGKDLRSPSHSPPSHRTILVLFVCFLIPCTVILSHSRDVWVCLFIFHVLDETEWSQEEQKDV